MMSTVELQNNIIRKVLETNNPKLLEVLNNLLLLNKEEQAVGYTLSDFEHSVINESLEQYRLGNTISNNEVFNKTKKWLEE